MKRISSKWKRVLKNSLKRAKNRWRAVMKARKWVRKVRWKAILQTVASTWMSRKWLCKCKCNSKCSMAMRTVRKAMKMTKTLTVKK